MVNLQETKRKLHPGSRYIGTSYAGHQVTMKLDQAWDLCSIASLRIHAVPFQRKYSASNQRDGDTQPGVLPSICARGSSSSGFTV